MSIRIVLGDLLNFRLAGQAQSDMVGMNERVCGQTLLRSDQSGNDSGKIVVRNVPTLNL